MVLLLRVAVLDVEAALLFLAKECGQVINGRTHRHAQNLLGLFRRHCGCLTGSKMQKVFEKLSGDEERKERKEV